MCRKLRGMIILATIVLAMVSLWNQQGSEAAPEVQKTYVGTDRCNDCHDAQYKNFKTYSKKAHSYKSITTMKKGLTNAEFEQCLECHTTGYGKAGGFRSEQDTPQLRDVGCETCHGPGSIHVETQDPKDIKGKLVAKDCEVCHNSERVSAFKYKPLIFGGAH